MQRAQSQREEEGRGMQANDGRRMATPTGARSSGLEKAASHQGGPSMGRQNAKLSQTLRAGRAFRLRGMRGHRRLQAAEQGKGRAPGRRLQADKGGQVAVGARSLAEWVYKQAGESCNGLPPSAGSSAANNAGAPGNGDTATISNKTGAPKGGAADARACRGTPSMQATTAAAAT